MANGVNVRIKNDKSVEKTIKQTASKLEKKFLRKTPDKTDEYLMKEQTTASRVMSVISSIIVILIIAFASVICLGTVVSSLSKTPSSYFGYSTLQVVSGSMTKDKITIKGVDYDSGFEIGDKIVVRAVDTDTLKIGDKIAFFAYRENYQQYHNLSKQVIDVPADTKTKYDNSIAKIFGFQTQKIREAGKNGGTLVFHHIVNIFEDQNGQRWFQTKGSANATIDSWFINEDMVVGIYNNTRHTKIVVDLDRFVSTDIGFLVILFIPIICAILILIKSISNDLRLALLELDVVEEKRKLSDEVCIKNKIGYRMDTKTKYKVLAHASEEEKPYYVSLLWHDGSAPLAIKKYVIRKKHILEPMKKMLDLNRECEQMLKDGKNMDSVAKYYMQGKEDIKKEQEKRRKQLKLIHESGLVTKKAKAQRKINKSKNLNKTEV